MQYLSSTRDHVRPPLTGQKRHLITQTDGAQFVQGGPLPCEFNETIPSPFAHGPARDHGLIGHTQDSIAQATFIAESFGLAP
jgi:hypothetical protein